MNMNLVDCIIGLSDYTAQGHSRLFHWESCGLIFESSWQSTWVKICMSTDMNPKHDISADYVCATICTSSFSSLQRQCALLALSSLPPDTFWPGVSCLSAGTANLLTSALVNQEVMSAPCQMAINSWMFLGLITTLTLFCFICPELNI